MTVLTRSGKNICQSLSVLLYESVSNRSRYGPDDLEKGELYEDEVIDIIKQYGFEYIGKGISRIVFKVPDKLSNTDTEIVIKFSRPSFKRDNTPSGIAQNECEEQVYANTRGGKYEHIFAPVLSVGINNLFIIMEYFTPATETEQEFEAVDAIYKQIEQSDMEFEVKPENIGIDIEDNSYYLIDYGIDDNRGYSRN